MRGGGGRLTPQQIILKVLEILDQIKDEYPFERFITLWCGAHDISDVKEGNFRTWLAWALLGKHLEELNPQEFRMIADSVRRETQQGRAGRAAAWAGQQAGTLTGG